MSGLVGSGKQVGATGSYWRRVLNRTWQREGDRLQFVIMKGDFGSCMGGAQGGGLSEQKRGDLLRGNCRNLSKR